MTRCTFVRFELTIRGELPLQRALLLLPSATYDEQWSLEEEEEEEEEGERGASSQHTENGLGLTESGPYACPLRVPTLSFLFTAEEHDVTPKNQQQGKESSHAGKGTKGPLVFLFFFLCSLSSSWLGVAERHRKNW